MMATQRSKYSSWSSRLCYCLQQWNWRKQKCNRKIRKPTWEIARVVALCTPFLSWNEEYREETLGRRGRHRYWLYHPVIDVSTRLGDRTTSKARRAGRSNNDTDQRLGLGDRVVSACIYGCDDICMCGAMHEALCVVIYAVYSYTYTHIFRV